MAGDREITVGRFANLLRLFFGLRAGSPSPETGAQVLPIFDVNDMTDPTVPYLRGERAMVGSVGLAAPGAGNWNYSGILNPTGSGCLVVVTGVRYRSSVAGDLLMLTGAVGPFTPSAQRGTTDTRWNNLLGAATVNGGAQATDPTTFPANIKRFLYNVNANESYMLHAPWVLVPGAALWVAAFPVATPVTYCAFSWYERTLNPVEAASP